MLLFILGFLIGVLVTFLFHVEASQHLRRMYIEAQELNQSFRDATQ